MSSGPAPRFDQFSLLNMWVKPHPDAFAMGARIPRDYAWSEEPAGVFRPPASA